MRMFIICDCYCLHHDFFKNIMFETTNKHSYYINTEGRVQSSYLTCDV
jgi:spore coat polysaccharide biosynthesis predicted glycosyltransferase SpsG